MPDIRRRDLIRGAAALSLASLPWVASRAGAGPEPVTPRPARIGWAGMGEALTAADYGLWISVGTLTGRVFRVWGRAGIGSLPVGDIRDNPGPATWLIPGSPWSELPGRCFELAVDELRGDPEAVRYFLDRARFGGLLVVEDGPIRLAFRDARFEHGSSPAAGIVRGLVVLAADVERIS